MIACNEDVGSSKPLPKSALRLHTQWTRLEVGPRLLRWLHGERACCPVPWPHSQSPQKCKRRAPTPQSLHLASTWAMWHMCPLYTHIQSPPQKKNWVPLLSCHYVFNILKFKRIFKSLKPETLSVCSTSDKEHLICLMALLCHLKLQYKASIRSLMAWFIAQTLTNQLCEPGLLVSKIPVRLSSTDSLPL